MLTQRSILRVPSQKGENPRLLKVKEQMNRLEKHTTEACAEEVVSSI